MKVKADIIINFTDKVTIIKSRKGLDKIKHKTLTETELLELLYEHIEKSKESGTKVVDRLG